MPTLWSQAKGLVYLSLRATWPRRIADLSLHTSLAERWEQFLPTWSVEGRTVSMSNPSDRYRVRLSDGAALFEIESQAAYDRCAAQLLELLEYLTRPGMRHRPTYMTHAQYLVPFPGELSALVKRLESHLFNSVLPKSLGANMIDFAYLADFNDAEGRRFQLNLGPVTKQESVQRVNAAFLADRPELAMFLAITNFRATARKTDDFGFSSLVDPILSIGQTVVKGLLI